MYIWEKEKIRFVPHSSCSRPCSFTDFVSCSWTGWFRSVPFYSLQWNFFQAIVLCQLLFWAEYQCPVVLLYIIYCRFDRHLVMLFISKTAALNCSFNIWVHVQVVPVFSIQACVRNLLTSTKTLKQILEDIGSVLKMFWRAALPSTETTSQHEKVRDWQVPELREDTPDMQCVFQ